MLGGGSEKVFQQDHQTGLEYSRKIQKIIGELVKKLENSNKTLTDEEKRTIAKKMRDFEVLERELFETAWNIQKYSQLLKVVEAESRPEIISYKHIEKYVEKYNHLLSRYERNGNSFNTLISLLKDCCDGGEGEGCKTL
jgi:hemerythrin-like domain-containing protein